MMRTQYPSSIYGRSRVVSASRRCMGGFTLVEMLVAVALFTSVMLIAIGALTAIVAADRRAQSTQAIIDNLDFALDDMSRTVRTGTDYHCVAGGTDPGNESSASLATPGDCSLENTNGSQYIAVKNSDGKQVVYWFVPQCTPSGGCIKKWKEGDISYSIMTSSEVSIDTMQFFVLGACPRSGGSSACSATNSTTQQPRITMILRGHIMYQGKPAASLDLQTNMTQRIYDI